MCNYLHHAFRLLQGTSVSKIFTLARTPSAYKWLFGTRTIDAGKVIFIAYESHSHTYPNIIQVPYPTKLHDIDEKYGKTLTISSVTDGLFRRNYTILFAANVERFQETVKPKSTGIRKALIYALSKINTSDIKIVTHPRQGSWIHKYQYSSQHCIQLPGDTQVRRAFFDSCLLGCIPVIFDELSYRLYDGLLGSPSRFSVILNSPSSVHNLLNSSQDTLRLLQYNLRILKPAMQYAYYQDEGFDAFAHILWSLAWRSNPKEVGM